MYIFIFFSKFRYKVDFVLLSKGAVIKLYQLHAISSVILYILKRKKTLFHFLFYMIHGSMTVIPLNDKRKFMSTLVKTFFFFGGRGGGGEGDQF